MTWNYRAHRRDRIETAPTSIAEAADVILAVGTRLQDFTTGSVDGLREGRRGSSASIVGRHDASKHLSQPVVGDAKLGARGARARRCRANVAAGAVDRQGEGRAQRPGTPTWPRTSRPETGRIPYAQAIGVVNDLCDPRDRIVAAAGGLPAEVTANWRTLEIGSGRRGVRLLLHGLMKSPVAGARALHNPNVSPGRIRSFSPATDRTL